MQLRIRPIHLAPLLLACLGGSACKRENSGFDEKADKILARLDAIEKKIDQGGIGRPGAGQPAPRAPMPTADPKATYSVPIEGDPAKGLPTAKVTLVSAKDFA
jgi:hypothetical protein